MEVCPSLLSVAVIKNEMAKSNWRKSSLLQFRGYSSLLEEAKAELKAEIWIRNCMGQRP